jgi:aminopeptidase
MPDARVERLAGVLVGYSTRVQPGELVLIDGSVPAAPLIREVYREVLRAGGHPLTRVFIEGISDWAPEILLRVAPEELLDVVEPSRADDLELCDVRIAISAEWNTRELSGIDSARQARWGRARQVVRDRFLQRAADGEVRWTLTEYPTHSTAQDAEMSLEQWEDFVYRAGMLDREDPVAEWRAFGESLQRVATFLDGVDELRVVGEDTDLRLGFTGRTWMPSRGQENFPDGEVFSGPVETSVEGTIRFSFPGVFQGRQVDDVRLRFESGEVVEATAARGQEFLREMIAMDDGARRAGEFAFGLNDAITQYTRNTLFDEKIGGTVHLALGTGYPETGSQNRSGLHWDLICDLRRGSEVYADGELVYRDGAFLAGVL